jgi:hypothetical protein
MVLVHVKNEKKIKQKVKKNKIKIFFSKKIKYK